jgi:hypothetical protein
MTASATGLPDPSLSTPFHDAPDAATTNEAANKTAIKHSA